MKFETPKMNISLFAVENVVTASQGGGGGTTPTTSNYDTAKDNLMYGNNAVALNNIVEFTFN